MELDDEVCICFHVTKRKVMNFIRLCRPRRASQLSQCGGAGTGCGWCRPLLVHYFRQATGRSSADDPDRMSAQQYASRRLAYLRAGKKRRR